MMNTRLITFLEENKALDKAQIGFTNDNRTSDHLLTLKTIVNTVLVSSINTLFFAYAYRLFRFRRDPNAYAYRR